MALVISSQHHLTSEQQHIQTDTMAPVVEKIVDPVTLGEGPHWDVGQQCLYFVSIFDQTIHKFVPATKKHTKTKLDGRVSFITPVEGTKDNFVVGVERRVLVVKWNGENGAPADLVKVIAEVDKDQPITRFNDAKADPRGRLYAGTMAAEDASGDIEKNKGSLYKLEADGSHAVLLDNLSISNGLAWDVAHKYFYYIDSLDFAIRRYDYDVNTGDIANSKTIFDFKVYSLPGLPDGMTIDTDGNLWVANFDGSQVLKVDPTAGKLLQKVEIPARQVTSVAFGGANLDELYVTSASLSGGSRGEQKPPCGATFRVTGLGVKGLPMMSAKLS